MFQLGATAESIIESVRDFFDLVFLEFSALWFWPVVVLGLMLLAVIVMSFLVGFSYENRILKSVNKINSYFLTKPFITEENLVEFNLKMKKVPKVLRNNWQIYMLNREDTPTTYINVNTCIDKPLRTSSIEKNIGNFTIFTIFLTLLSFIVGLKYAQFVMIKNTPGDTLFFAALVPLAIVLIYTIFILIIKAAKNDIYSMLYDNFPLYERNLTKAVSTLPAYVDYEILFTKKEIKEGIPILQQYLEKRALVEQQELEKARANSVACEEYDFAELGIDGSLVLERAMKESETFIRTRNRLQEECGSIETEKENYKKNFEQASKDYQRKLQASRENLESLKAQQESSTNRIESNYIRKQQADEIKKQQQLEKDNEEATAKFNEEQISLQQEIDKRQQEIEEKKAFVQQAMLLEFKHYANTLYKALTQKATELGNQKLIALAQENTDLKALLTDMQGIGMTDQQLDPNASLIQQTDVTTENLYEMTASDQNQMQENREMSEVMSQEEDQKQEEMKAQQEAQANAEGQPEVAPQVDANAYSDIPQPTDPIATEEAPAVDANADVNADGNTDGTVDANGGVADGTIGGDGGQQMDVQPEVTQPQPEEDLDAIQKQIEEENNKLQQQKQEFENDLNNTISQMDAQAEPVVEQPVAQEVPAEPTPVVETPAPQPEPAPVQEEKPVAQPEPEPAEESEERTSSRSRSASRGRAAGRGRTAGRDTSKGGSAKKATSEIDALNAEMQKLIDSTKN
ncbi:MAG: hypothetical protein IJB10_01955 [Clostridia bacterium]|nr:hypothetical protein [Clostridia bacterium]